MYRAAGLELYGEPFRPLDELLALVDAIDDANTVSEVCAERGLTPESQTDRESRASTSNNSR